MQRLGGTEAGYEPPAGYVPTMANPLLDHKYNADFNSLTGVNRVIVPFLACGDLSAFDSDMTYQLEGASKAPAQGPINPPYKQFLDMRRGTAGDEPAPPQGTQEPGAWTLPPSQRIGEAEAALAELAHGIQLMKARVVAAQARALAL